MICTSKYYKACYQSSLAIGYQSCSSAHRSLFFYWITVNLAFQTSCRLLSQSKGGLPPLLPYFLGTFQTQLQGSTRAASVICGTFFMMYFGVITIPLKYRVTSNLHDYGQGQR